MTTSSMIISLALLSLFFPHLIILFLSAQQPPDLVYHKCFILGKGTYKKPSTYHTNLITLLSNLTSHPNNCGFYTSSFGNGPDTVYAQGLCRTDISDQDTCLSCLNDAAARLPKLCPNHKQAFGYQDYCTLLYSSSSMSGKYMDSSFSYGFNNPQNSADGNSFTKALKELMQKLKLKASGGDDTSKADTDGEIAGESETVYGLAQCIPELSQQDCSDCLENAIRQIPSCCENKIGGRVIKLSCNLRFEKVPFYYV